MNNIEIIAAARSATNKAIADHDIEVLSEYWMDDIVIIRGNGNIISTKIAAEHIWRKMFIEEPAVSYVRHTEEIIINSNNIIAWEKGKWTGMNTYSSGGSYAAVWCNHKGVWKLKAELFVAL